MVTSLPPVLRDACRIGPRDARARARISGWTTSARIRSYARLMPRYAPVSPKKGPVRVTSVINASPVFQLVTRMAATRNDADMGREVGCARG